MVIKISGLNIVGAKRSDGTERQINDYYATDPIAIEKLLELEDVDGSVWENACGEGNLSKALKAKDIPTFSSDLVDRGYGYTCDFLENTNYCKETLGYKPDWIITNPPYKHGQEWVEKSLEAVKDDGKVALLMKLVFLESISRYKMFQELPPKNIYVFSRRLGIYKNNKKTENKGLVAYAWFIWEKGYEGKPKIDWILT